MFVFKSKLRFSHFTLLSILAFQAAFATQKEVIIDVSGLHGANGRDGRSGSNQTERRKDGGDGENASPSTAGTSAGQISLDMSRSSTGNLVLSGTISKPTVQIERSSTNLVTQNYSNTIHLNSGEVINFLAIGGNGGHGANGGNGGQGGRAENGTDASRFSSGSDGRRGGTGGIGGEGSSGSDAGNGGTISLKISEADTDLLLAINQIRYQGGSGGKRGEHGQGGPGGDPGRDGDDYRYEVCSGSGENRRCSTYRKSGGDGGPRGHTGTTPSTPLYNGRDGQLGSFKVEVLSSNGSTTYSSFYELSIESFDVIPEKDDGILEPNENIFVRNIVIRNRGTMPSPQRKLNMKIHGVGVELTKDSIDYTGVINAGESITIPGELSFKIKDQNQISNEQRLSQTSSISSRAFQTGINRFHPSSLRTSEFTVSYPIEISPIQIPRSLAPGQTANIVWKVKNVSNKPFGTSSEIKRRIETHLNYNTNSNVQYSQFYYTTSDGQNIQLDKDFLKSIENLAPGQEVIVQGFLTIKETAIPYTKLNLNLNLNIDEFNPNNNLRLIQRNTVSINIAKSFKKSPNSQVLILTNKNTTQQNLDHWNSLLSTLNLKADVWDLNYEGFINFIEPLRTNEESLKDLFSGGLIIVLNNPLENDSSATDLLKSTEIKEVLRTTQTHFLIVNQDSNGHRESIQKLLLSDIHNQTSLPNIEEAEKLLNSNNGVLPAPLKIEIQDDYIGRPYENHLVSYANEIAEYLKNSFPKQSYSLSYSFEPLVIEDNFFSDTYRIGYIIIHPETQANQQKISEYITNRNHTNLVESDLTALIQSLPTQLKTATYLRSLVSNTNLKNYSNQIMDSIFNDFLIEYNNLILRKSSQYVIHQMEVLKQINEVVINFNQKFSLKRTQTVPYGRSIIELMSRIRYAAYSIQQEKGYYFSRVDNRLLNLVYSETQDVIKNSFGVDLPKRSSIGINFSLTQSNKDSLKEQKEALTLLEIRTDELISFKSEDFEPLNWLLGNNSFLRLINLKSNVRSNQPIRFLNVDEVRALNRAASKANAFQTQFSNQRIQEFEGYSVEAFETQKAIEK